MIIESPVETAVRAHGLTTGNQRQQRLESIQMRLGTGSYWWAIHNLVDRIQQAMEPDRAWCPFYREFIDNLPEGA